MSDSLKFEISINIFRILSIELHLHTHTHSLTPTNIENNTNNCSIKIIYVSVQFERSKGIYKQEESEREFILLKLIYYLI